jgi:hypothetical protein
MENNEVKGSRGSTRRTFLSASAVTAVAAPILARSAPADAATARLATAGAGSALDRREPDSDLRAMLGEVDPRRIQTTILRLTQFGTSIPHPADRSGARIGAATAWVSQMQAIATIRPDDRPAADVRAARPSNILVPTTITNVIATLKGTASPEGSRRITTRRLPKCRLASDAPVLMTTPRVAVVPIRPAVRHPPFPGTWCRDCRR